MTRLVVGLGNPGPQYEVSRHNAGFLVLDLLEEDLRVMYWKDLAGAKVAVVSLGDDEVVLARPLTYMNRSGSSVKRLAEIYDVAVEDIIVIHDDIDLPEGSVRVKRGGGHGGHNGLRSVTDTLQSRDYVRVRVGVGRPPGRQDPADYVLEPMSRAAADVIGQALPRAAEAVMHVLESGAESAMQLYNAG